MLEGLWGSLPFVDSEGEDEADGDDGTDGGAYEPLPPEDEGSRTPDREGMTPTEDDDGLSTIKNNCVDYHDVETPEGYDTVVNSSASITWRDGRDDTSDVEVELELRKDTWVLKLRKPDSAHVVSRYPESEKDEALQDAYRLMDDSRAPNIRPGSEEEVDRGSIEEELTAGDETEAEPEPEDDAPLSVEGEARGEIQASDDIESEIDEILDDDEVQDIMDSLSE